MSLQEYVHGIGEAIALAWEFVWTYPGGVYFVVGLLVVIGIFKLFEEWLSVRIR